jgi:hypothetical protein
VPSRFQVKSPKRNWLQKKSRPPAKKGGIYACLDGGL